MAWLSQFCFRQQLLLYPGLAAVKVPGVVVV